MGQGIKMIEETNHENGTGFLKPLVNAYSTFPLHGMTTIPGKISGSLLVAGAITRLFQICAISFVRN